MDEMFEVIQSLKTVLDEVMTRLEGVEKRQSDLEKMLVQDILDPVKAHIDEIEYNDKLDAFKGRVGDRLDPYLDYIKNVNGEDYDVYKDLMDGYDKWEETNPGVEKPAEEDYITAGIDVIKSKMEELKGLLGADNVEAKIDEEGNIEVKADDEEVAEEGETVADVTDSAEGETEEKADGETEAEEEKADEEPMTIADQLRDEAEGEEVEEDPEEIEADLAALEEEMKRYK